MKALSPLRRTAQTLAALRKPAMLIEHVTDMEGNGRFWATFLAESRVISRDEKGLFVKPDCAFVFGGDSIDRGGTPDSYGAGDLRVLEDLVALKKRCPSQVDLIIGNRDGNKMRLLTELHPSVLKKEARAFWVPTEEASGKNDSRSKRVEDFIFPRTMGAPLAFEARRQELESRGQPHSDDDVVASYLDSMKPGGVLAEYLTLAQLASIRGDTAFVHGAVTASNLGYVPPSDRVSASDKGIVISDFRQWAEALNSFAKAEVTSFVTGTEQYLQSADPEPWSWEGGYHHPQPGSRLLQYCDGKLPDMVTDARSVIYSTFVNNGRPAPLDKPVERALADAGIRYLVVGHHPYADAPYLIPSASDVTVIGSDTSYAAGTSRPDPNDLNKFVKIDPASLAGALGNEEIPSKENTRGVAFAITSISQDEDGRSRVTLRGRLADGSRYECDAIPGGAIGKWTEDGKWLVTLVGVKDMSGKVHDYYLTRGEGHQFFGRFLCKDEVKLVA